MVRDRRTNEKVGRVVMYTTHRHPWVCRYRAETPERRSLGVFDNRAAAEHRVRLHAGLETPEERTYRLQWIEGGMDITSHPYCEAAADTVAVWAGAHGDTHLYALAATFGGWRFSKGHQFDWERMLFSSPEDALDHAGQQTGVEYRVAVCRCDIPGGVCD